ncbi:MAG: 30S ribosomal protein S16 [Candidatus Omnitrophota bacterium]
MRKVGKSANKRYNFKVVAIQKTASRDGKFLEELGSYDPAKKTANLTINQERLDFWLNKGARLSETVSSLIKRSKGQ